MQLTKLSSLVLLDTAYRHFPKVTEEPLVLFLTRICEAAGPDKNSEAVIRFLLEAANLSDDLSNVYYSVRVITKALYNDSRENDNEECFRFLDDLLTVLGSNKNTGNVAMPHELKARMTKRYASQERDAAQRSLNSSRFARGRVALLAAALHSASLTDDYAFWDSPRLLTVLFDGLTKLLINQLVFPGSLNDPCVNPNALALGYITSLPKENDWLDAALLALASSKKPEENHTGTQRNPLLERREAIIKLARDVHTAEQEAGYGLGFSWFATALLANLTLKCLSKLYEPDQQRLLLVTLPA